MSDDTDLSAGLYERLITTTLKDRLARLDSARISVQTRPVDPAEAHATFARHIEAVVARTLRGLPEKDRRERQPEIVNQPSRAAAERTRKRLRSHLRNCSLCNL